MRTLAFVCIVCALLGLCSPYVGATQTKPGMIGDGINSQQLQQHRDKVAAMRTKLVVPQEATNILKRKPKKVGFEQAVSVYSPIVKLAHMLQKDDLKRYLTKNVKWGPLEQFYKHIQTAVHAGLRFTKIALDGSKSDKDREKAMHDLIFAKNSAWEQYHKAMYGISDLHTQYVKTAKQRVATLKKAWTGVVQPVVNSAAEVIKQTPGGALNPIVLAWTCASAYTDTVIKNDEIGVDASNPITSCIVSMTLDAFTASNTLRRFAKGNAKDIDAMVDNAEFLFFINRNLFAATHKAFVAGKNCKAAAKGKKNVDCSAAIRGAFAQQILEAIAGDLLLKNQLENHEHDLMIIASAIFEYSIKPIIEIKLGLASPASAPITKAVPKQNMPKGASLQLTQ